MIADPDYLIVGGGSAGCVLARRLSESGRNRVLLCEAGRDIGPHDVPSEITSIYPGELFSKPDFRWTGLKVQPVHAHPRRGTMAYDQGKVLGGGSSINGMMFNRGSPDDYEEWERRGAKGWGWQSVLPFFRKVESDLDFPEGELHGSDGLIRVHRTLPEAWSEHAKAVAAAIEGLGLPYVPDQNGAFADGYYPVAISGYEGARETVATRYLDAATRARPNLSIETDLQVSRLTLQGGCCTGVVVETPAGSREVAARNVIVCAGAIGTPALMLRSGLGPAEHLRGMGIRVAADLPGVGQRLMEHPAVVLGYFLAPRARLDAGHPQYHIHVGARYSSAAGFGAPSGDMIVAAASRTAWHRVGRRLGATLVSAYHAFSEEGTVSLASPDWRTPPSVALNMLSDQRDLRRLSDGFRLIAGLHAVDAMRAVASDPFPTGYSERVRRASSSARWNRLQVDALATLLDGPRFLRSMLMRRFVANGPTLAELLRSDDALTDFVKAACTGIWHASCSCRMGSEDDPRAVVDEAGRVRGVRGLRIADASVFPRLPNANTNAPVLMVAEKLAAAMLRDGAYTL